MGSKHLGAGGVAGYLAGLALLLASQAGVARTPKLAPFPVENFYVSAPVHAAPDGALSWWGMVHTSGDRWETGESRWNPRTGELVQRPLHIDGSVAGGVDLGEARLLLLGTGETAERALLIRADDTRLETTLTLQRTHPVMLVLPDQSVLLLGGKAAGARSNAVELLRIQDNKLQVERLPDIPGKPRAGFSALALDDTGVLLMGGEEGGYIGCMPCTSTSYFLDLATRTWRAGPALPEAMSDASATLLPDGKVLIAGGWTPEYDWSAGPTRATYLLDPASGRFTPGPPLPAPVAIHTARWFGAAGARQLLVAGGNSAAIQAFDPDTGQWRLVGEACQGDQQGARFTFPFTLGEYSFLGRVHSEGAFCADWQANLSVDPMRLPAAGGSARIDPEEGIALYRNGMAFAPARAGAPALLAGGSIHTGMNSYLPTAAVDAIDSDGTVRALPAMTFARTGARAVGFANGSYLVLGGRGGKANERPASLEYPAPEWFSGRTHRWTAMAPLPPFAVLDRQTGGGLLLADSEGGVTRVRVSENEAGLPAVTSIELPKLKSPRMQDEALSLQLKGLADGRIVLACGQTRRAGAKDDGQDSFAPTRDVDRFDPKTRQWHRSAPSRSVGGSCAVFDDGRVVRLGRVPVRGKSTDKSPVIMELSTPDSNAWRPFGGALSKVLHNVETARLFVLQDELFVVGRERRTGAGGDSVQWFNQAKRRWEIMWDTAAQDHGGMNVGRVLVRQLGNGKRVVLPVAGPNSTD